jgi:hypothetical protein
MITLIPMLMLLQTQPTEPIKASELKAVVGPQAPRYPDPAVGMGEDRISLKMRRAARQGNVPGVEVPAGTQAVSDRISGFSGWKAYQVQVPGKGSLSMRLHSDHEAWFRVTTVNRWGRMEEGMLQNRIYKGKPEASCHNPKDAPSTVFFIVDTTDASAMSEPYTLDITWK